MSYSASSIAERVQNIEANLRLKKGRLLANTAVFAIQKYNLLIPKNNYIT